MDFNENGIINIAECMIYTAKKDYKKAYNYIISEFGYVPSEHEYIKRYNQESYFIKTGRKKGRISKKEAFNFYNKWKVMNYYYEVERFIRNNPYNLYDKELIPNILRAFKEGCNG